MYVFICIYVCLEDPFWSCLWTRWYLSCVGGRVSAQGSCVALEEKLRGGALPKYTCERQTSKDKVTLKAFKEWKNCCFAWHILFKAVHY